MQEPSVGKMFFDICMIVFLFAVMCGIVAAVPYIAVFLGLLMAR